MHILQPRHVKLKPDEVKKLMNKFDISVSQLPVIKVDDPGLPEGCLKGNVILLERKDNDNNLLEYFRVVI